MKEMEVEKRRTVVLVPYPTQGHLTPMLQLASILNSKGFSITVAHTDYNFPNPETYPEFTFVPLSDKIADSDASFIDTLQIVLSSINKNCKDSFKEYMVRELADHVNGTDEVACVIYDSILRFVDPVAVEMKIPTIVLRTSSAAHMYSHLVMFQLQADKLLPVTESQLEEAVPNLHPLRFKDLPLPATMVISEAWNDFMHDYLDIKSSTAIIWNTMEMLDDDSNYLNQLQQHHWKVPFFPIGPFSKLAAPELPTSLLKEDTSCLSWLDKQAPNSVIFVSLGSVVTIDKVALTEMAWELAKSEQPFLWVVRDSLLNGSERAIECLPHDFSEIVKERGRVVTWAPQKKVLAHPSVGGFLTHCGWNSTLESMCEGVPMICMPFFNGQMVNARYVTHVWKVGLELEGNDQGSIEKAVRNLMVGEQGKEIRRNALDMKQKLDDTISEGGLCYESLEDLVKFIISLSGKK